VQPGNAEHETPDFHGATQILFAMGDESEDNLGVAPKAT